MDANNPIAQLKDAILTIGRSLPLGMEILFSREPDSLGAVMVIVEPNGSATEYRFKAANPLPVFQLVTLLREQQLETALRALLGGIDIETDPETKLINREALESAIESALAVLADGWEPDETHPANAVTSAPALVSYPVGSLGEPVEVAS